MGLILGTLFMGVQILAHHLGPYPSHETTVMSQLGTAVFGGGTVLYVVLQFATAAILTLAANTAYADFPRLSSIIAHDGYLPRQLANRGDRLVFSNGVLVLAIAAGVLIIAFGGKTNALIPLYAVGVFLSFTLSQAGMVRHHQKERESGYKRNIVINAVGASATLIVLIIVGTTKFTSGAWVPLVVIPLIVVVFKAIKRHYRTVADGLRVTPDYKPRRMNHTVVVLVGGVHRGVLEGLAYARSLSPEPPRGGVGRLRRGGAGATRAASGRSSASTSRSRSSTPRTASSPVRSSATSTSSTPGGRTTSSRCCSPSSSCVTGGATCSTTRPRCCSRAASCSGRARS